MTEYSKAEDLVELAEKVKKDNDIFAPIRTDLCRIAFQYSSDAKKSNGKTVYADTRKVPDYLKQFIPYDFVITFYEPNTSTLDEDRKEKLMYHELRHVGFDPSGPKYYIVPHDVEDFEEILSNWGMKWIL